MSKSKNRKGKGRRRNDDIRLTFKKKSSNAPPPSLVPSESSSHELFPLLEVTEKSFDAIEQDALSQNEFNRYMPASQMVSHALVSRDSEGRWIAQQFKAFESLQEDTTQVIPLDNIRLFEQDGAVFAEGMADGTTMIAERSVDFETRVGTPYAQNHRLFFFSPKPNAEKLYTNDTQPCQAFRDDLTKDQEKKISRIQSENQIRGGKMRVISEDIPKRYGKKRYPIQSKVMKGSAIDKYQWLLENFAQELSTDRIEIIERSLNARAFTNTTEPVGQERPEHCHALSYGLTPMSLQPQRRSNIGAAPKWFNSVMLTIERAARWFGLRRPESFITHTVTFNMFLGDVIEDGRMCSEITEAGNTIRLEKTLTPWVLSPSYPRPTDVSQGTMVAYHLLMHVKPDVVFEIESSLSEKSAAFLPYREVALPKAASGGLPELEVGMRSLGLSA